MSDTPLKQKLKRLIEANGPISIADFMAHCLSDPQHGYYATRDPFGVAGDFITAPEVSQMFGEIVGAWLIETWRMIGAPSPTKLVELGPGRGTLMVDILRIAARSSDFASAISVHLVETSLVLQAQQAETLAPFRADVTWHASLADVPSGPFLLVANEFFDALPIRQYVRSEGQWRERVVRLDSEGRLAFGIDSGTVTEMSRIDGRVVPPTSLAEGDHAKHGGGGGYFRRDLHSPPPPPPNSAVAEFGSHSRPSREHPTWLAVPLTRFAGEQPAAIREIRPAGNTLIAEIARRIVDDGGAALIIDYGYQGPAVGDTLQAIRGHEYSDPLESPGEADLTAHVDFSALARNARAEGATIHGPLGQGDFLISLGLLERAGRLGAKADAATRESLRVAVERLAAPDQMGTLLKAMALTRPGVMPSPFHALGL